MPQSGTTEALPVQSPPAEVSYADELAFLEGWDEGPKPPGWQLSPRAVVTFVCGSRGEKLEGGKGKKPEKRAITEKFVGDRAIVERSVVTLAGERGLLLVGEPGTAKSMLSELLAAAGAAEELLAELEDYGLIRRARSYGTQTLSVLRSAVRLREYGVQPRHLRVIKAAAERETALVEQAVAPLTRQKGSREPALRAARDLAQHIAALHAILVEDGLTEAGLASQQQHPGKQEGGSREAPGLRSASGR